MKNEKKIRKMLGNKYHLCSSNKGEWVLYRYYQDSDVYFSKDNKAIMSYKTDTEEDLYKYLKAHKEWNLDLIITKTISAILFVPWILSVINIFKHNDTLRLIILAWLLPNVIISLVMNIVRRHNIKVSYRDLMYTAKKVTNEDSE